MHIEQQIWILKDQHPELESTNIYIVPIDAKYFCLYDFDRARCFPLTPTERTLGRAVPVAFTLRPNRIRLGAIEIIKEGDMWIVDQGTMTEGTNEYWEDICFKAPYKMKCRRRAVKESPKNGTNHKTFSAGEVSEDGISEDEHESNDSTSDSSQDVSSAEEVWVSEAESEDELLLRSEAGTSSEAGMSSDEHHSTATSQSSSDEVKSSLPLYSHSNSELGTADGDENVPFKAREASSELPRHPRPGLEPLLALIQQSRSHSKEESESDSEESSLDNTADAESKRKKSTISCDRCPANNLIVFFSCNLCTEGNTFDLCQECRLKGSWCTDRFHPLRTVHIDVWGGKCVVGLTSDYVCKPRQQIVVEKYSPQGSKTVFSYRHTDRYDCLYDSPPAMHPTKPLLAWPLGGWKVMFADVEKNMFFTHPLRLNLSSVQRLIRESAINDDAVPLLTCLVRPITVQVHFTPNGEFFCAATIYKSLRSSSFSIDIWQSRLSLDSTELQAPKTVSRVCVDLGPLPQKKVSQIPFHLNWEHEYIYLTMSSERLRVYRVPLKTRSNLDKRPVMTLRNEIVLPRSARSRSIYFFPRKETHSNHKVVIGSREGGAALHPVVIYLSDSDLGEWIAVEEAEHFGIGEKRRVDSMREQFDSDDDCDMIPYDPNFQC
jgi:hypothetical protein